MCGGLPARLVCSDRDQAEIEGSSKLADLLEGGTDRETGVFTSVVVLAVGLLGDGAVAGVTEVVSANVEIPVKERPAMRPVQRRKRT